MTNHQWSLMGSPIVITICHHHKGLETLRTLIDSCQAPHLSLSCGSKASWTMGIDSQGGGCSCAQTARHRMRWSISNKQIWYEHSEVNNIKWEYCTILHLWYELVESKLKIHWNMMKHVLFPVLLVSGAVAWPQWPLTSLPDLFLTWKISSLFAGHSQVHISTASIYRSSLVLILISWIL